MADYLETVDQWEKTQLAKLAHMLAYWQKQPVEATKEIPENIGAAGRNIGAYTAGFVGDVASIVPGANMAAGGQAPTSEDLLEDFGRAEHWSNLPSAFVAPGPGELVTGAKAALKAMLGLGKEMSGMVGLAQSLFHGTPHRFDKFDLKAIGTGEGAQAYGHGLYFAESPGVAKSYQADLVGDLDMNTPEGAAKAALEDFGWGRKVTDQQKKETIEQAKRRLDQLKNNADGQWAQTFSDAKGLLDDGWQPPIGHLYEVDIPDETIGKMLDWDAPLSEQPDVMAAIRKAAKENDMDIDKYLDYQFSGLTLEDVGGQEGYRHLANMLGNEAYASQALTHTGIPGIRFFDGSSRTRPDWQGIINKSLQNDPYYRPEQLGKVIDHEGYGIGRLDSSTLRQTDVTEWVVYDKKGKDIEGFERLKDAKEWIAKHPSTDKGTRNIVVFNPDDISQVKRDGELVYKAGKKKSLDEIIDIVDKY